MYKATYWFFQWLKWCSCCGGHYAGRVDFGIDFNVSFTHITLYMSMYESVWERKSEQVDLSCWYYAEQICVDLVGNYRKLATDPVDLFPELFLSNICANLFSVSKFNVPLTKPFLLQCWSISGFFNNCTFMFCRCRSHSNVMTNQEDISLDQS